MTIWIAHVEVTLAPTGIVRSIRFETFLLEITPGQIHVRNLRKIIRPQSVVGRPSSRLRIGYSASGVHCSFHAGDRQSDGGKLFNLDPHSRAV